MKTLEELKELLKLQKAAGDDKRFLTMSNIHYLEAKESYESGQYAKAIVHYEQVLASVRLNLGVITGFDEAHKKEAILNSKRFIMNLLPFYIQAYLQTQDMEKLVLSDVIMSVSNALQGITFLSSTELTILIEQAYLRTVKLNIRVLAGNDDLVANVLDESRYLSAGTDKTNKELAILYSSLIKALRGFVDNDPILATKLAEYAKSAAIKYKALAMDKHATEEEIRNLYFSCIASEDQDTFNQRYKTLARALGKKYVEEKDRHMYLARALARVFILYKPLDFDSKIRSAKAAHKHFSLARNAQSYLYGVYVLLFEVVRDFFAAKNLAEMLANESSYPTLSSDGDLRERTYHVAKSNYESLVYGLKRLAGKDESGAIVVEPLAGVVSLRQGGFMDDKLTFKLLREIASSLAGETVREISLREESESVETQAIQKVIANHETATVELKETLIYDTRTKQKNDSLVTEVLKAVAAFFNTAGGQLFIGVNDDSEIIGLDRDLRCMQGKTPSNDIFARFLQAKIAERLGRTIVSRVDLSFPVLGDKTICLIKVQAGDVPIFLDKKDFYFRAYGQSNKLEGADMWEYLKKNFEKR